jgi:hypothetical protein
MSRDTTSPDLSLNAYMMHRVCPGYTIKQEPIGFGASAQVFLARSNTGKERYITTALDGIATSSLRGAHDDLIMFRPKRLLTLLCQTKTRILCLGLLSSVWPFVMKMTLSLD